MYSKKPHQPHPPSHIHHIDHIKILFQQMEVDIDMDQKVDTVLTKIDIESLIKTPSTDLKLIE
jgi:hypothetical protein